MRGSARNYCAAREEKSKQKQRASVSDGQNAVVPYDDDTRNLDDDGRDFAEGL